LGCTVVTEMVVQADHSAPSEARTSMVSLPALAPPT
jgi:hypothetical protein